MAQENTIKINSKTVQLSQPYKADMKGMVGREEEIQQILASWMAGDGRLPLSPLLIGEPGVGKNRMVYECTRICSKELYIFQGHEDVTAEDLMCATRFSDDPDKKMDYILQPLVTAMIRGGICFIDEIGKIRDRALAPLVSLLDERRYMDSTILGERIYADPGFRFIAATNTADMDANLLPDFIASRARPAIKVGYPEKKEIEAIIASRCSFQERKSGELIDLFWRLWSEHNENRPPSPRDTIQIFGFAVNLANYERNGKRSYSLENHGSVPVVGKRHLEESFTAFFGAR